MSSALAVSDLPMSTNLILLQRTAYIGCMTTKKIGNLRTEITLLQYGFADELVAGIYYACQSALGNKSILRSRWPMASQTRGFDSFEPTECCHPNSRWNINQAISVSGVLR